MKWEIRMGIFINRCFYLISTPQYVHWIPSVWIFVYISDNNVLCERFASNVNLFDVLVWNFLILSCFPFNVKSANIIVPFIAFLCLQMPNQIQSSNYDYIKISWANLYMFVNKQKEILTINILTAYKSFI